MNIDTDPQPLGRYVRSLAGADFSLQANTAAAPDPGFFYVLAGSRVVLRSEDFAEAQAHYKELCRVFWSERLDSSDRAAAMASAWGLLGLDIDNAAAARLITRLGSPADQKRLQQLRNRARFSRPGTPWRRSTP